jgi:hypothetical protein
MEEPTPCPGCGEIVGLQEMRKCKECRDLYCKECLVDGLCPICYSEPDPA